jgi:tetratricopeptide (TPR) repeat protein
LLEVWQRLSDGGAMNDPRAFARSTLRQLVSGSRLGISDPIVLAEVLEAYRGHRNALPEEQRAGLPPVGTYSRELGIFLVPITLPEPDPKAAEPGPVLAAQGLGNVTIAPCRDAVRYVHPDLAGGEGRREYWSGLCAEEEGDLEDAVVHLIRAERWLPHDPRVPLELGDLLCVMGYREAALLAFERAADRSPNPHQRAAALRGIGRCHLSAGQIESARAAYLKALALDPEDVTTPDWIEVLEGRGSPVPDPP